MQNVAKHTQADTLLLLIRRLVCTYLILFNTLLGTLGAEASEITVAVASNFVATEHELASVFERQSGHRVITSSGSTGKLFTQIVQGAPFDIFLAADTVRPRKLVKMGLAAEESYTIYAIGRLALWSPLAQSSENVELMLRQGDYSYLAMASPRTAPYGAAAAKVMQALDLSRHEKTVYGENITQCYQFVRTGHAELGFVALSQIMSGKLKGAFWLVPEALYPPVTQAAVVLKSVDQADKNAAVSAFMAFLAGSEARAIIAASGYGTTLP